MEIRTCPVCDQKMTSTHYCKICRRFVRHPYIMKGDYYLNEQTARRMDNNNEQQRILQERPSVNHNRIPPASAGQSQWKPVMPPMPGGSGAKKLPASLLGIMILAVVLVLAFLGVAFENRYDSPSVSFDSIISGDDSEDYTDDFNLEDWVEDYEELDERDVKAAGIACTSCGHFHTTGEEMKEWLFELIVSEGFIVEDTDEYSYNERYSDDTTWFSSSIVYYLEGQKEDSYPLLAVDFDTATGALHEVDMILEDPGQLVEITESVLKYLIENDDFVPDLSAIKAIKTGLTEAFENDNNFVYETDDVYIYGYVFDSDYTVYISSEAY
ncbi:MAG: hypothetical protein ACRDBO_01235 [Lachnospiraceae bacterium]